MPSYAYTQNIKVYDGIPFSFVMRKAGYYDIRQTKVGTIGMYGENFQSYSGLSLSSEQLTGSLLTVEIESGTLPDRTDTGKVWGCLETTGQSYAVLKKGYVNYNTAGSPTINVDTGVVSGFSTSDYLYESFGLSSANSWEINTAFSVTSNISARRQIFSSMAGTSGVYAGVSFMIDASNRLVMQLGLTTSSYDSITSSFTVDPNTKYYLKGTFDGSIYEFKYSTDGTTYTSIGTVSSTAKIYQSVVTRIGVYANAVSEVFTNGTVYLANTDVYVNGSLYWTPYGPTSGTAIGLLPSGVTDDGSAKTWNLFYNNGVFLLDTAATMSGYSWCGTISIPAHTV